MTSVVNEVDKRLVPTIENHHFLFRHKKGQPINLAVRNKQIFLEPYFYNRAA